MVALGGGKRYDVPLDALGELVGDGVKQEVVVKKEEEEEEGDAFEVRIKFNQLEHVLDLCSHSSTDYLHTEYVTSRILFLQ